MHSAQSGWSISVREESKLNKRRVDRRWCESGEGFGWFGSNCLGGWTTTLDAVFRDFVVVPVFERAGDGTGEGILRMMLSCKSTKDSFGNGEPRCGCFPWARDDKEDALDDELAFLERCHADLTEGDVGS